MVKRNIVLLDIDYITHDEKPVMRLFGKVKGEKSNDLIALDDSFVPYLYVLPVDDIDKCINDLKELEKEEELEFITKHNDSPDELLIIGFLDGEHVGNCSYERVGGSRRYKHRAGIGIALYQKFTGLGLGRLMLTALLEEIKSQGYEQAELTVKANNARAIHLYESFGFAEYGRLPNADKYDDGTYDADVLMVKMIK